MEKPQDFLPKTGEHEAVTRRRPKRLRLEYAKEGFAVISLRAPPNSDIGSITLHDTEKDADDCARLVGGFAYEIHGDGALTHTIASMSGMEDDDDA